MTPCADPTMIRRPNRVFGRWLVPVLVLGLLSACAGGGARKSTKPDSAVQPDTTTEAEPAGTAKASKGDPDARFAEALGLMKERQMKEARDAFLQLAKDFPQHSGPFTDLAILQYQGKQTQLAVANFEKAARINPENAVAWNWLGVIAREAKDYGKAEEAYGKALAIKPDYAAVHLNLGVLHDLYTRRPADALTHYRAYQKLAGDERLIVSAWIKELEAQLPPPAPAAPATDAATGATP